MNTQQKTAVSQLYSPSSGFYILSTPSSLLPCSLNLGGRMCSTGVPVRPEHNTVTFLYTLIKFDFVGLCICLHLLQKANFARCVYCRTLNYECVILYVLINMHESEVDLVKTSQIQKNKHHICFCLWNLDVNICIYVIYIKIYDTQVKKGIFG